MTVGYCRVSTAIQKASGLSLDAQASIILDFAMRNGLEPVNIEYEADAASAASLQGRPVLLDIIRRAKAGEVNNIIVQDWTRLFRNLVDAWQTFESLESAGVVFHNAVRPLDTTTADGEFSRDLELILGKRERLLVGERTSRALQEKKAQAEGRQINGKAPYGFRWSPTATKRADGRYNCVLIREPSESTIYKRIEALYASGAGATAIAAALNESQTWSRCGKAWNITQIRRMMLRIDEELNA